MVSSVTELKVARAVLSISASTWASAPSAARRACRARGALMSSNSAITSISVTRLALPARR